MGATRRVAIEGEIEAAGGMGAACSGSVELLRTHLGLLARGKVHAQVKLHCSRCLSEFANPASLEIEEEFFPLVDVGTGRRVELPGDYDGTLIDGDHVVDLSDVLRQCAIAAQPIKPLCVTDCLGLCQECGVDLNREACICNAVAVDPRWGALAALLDKS